MMFKIIFLLLTLTIIFSFTISVYADSKVIEQKCNNGIVTVSIINEQTKEPWSGITVYVYNDLRGSDITNRIETDVNGKIVFVYAHNTEMIRTVGADDLRVVPCIIEQNIQQSMVIFSTSDSHIGFFEENGITVVDLGTQFSIAGSGTMPDSIEVSSKYINGSILREEISPASTHGDWQIPNVYFSQQAYQGIYTLDLVTDGKITYTFQFEVRQVTSSDSMCLRPNSYILYNLV